VAGEVRIVRRLGVLAVAAAMAAASGCGAVRYKDGVYTADSSADERGGYGHVTVTIKSGKIADCEYEGRLGDGTVKDEDYGKTNGAIVNTESYEAAQLAVDAMRSYAEQLRQKGKLSSVDAISGATDAYNQFREAAVKALREAR
jgi:major membrane immunogen (membrane-anchored lipoprotein)